MFFIFLIQGRVTHFENAILKILICAPDNSVKSILHTYLSKLKPLKDQNQFQEMLEERAGTISILNFDFHLLKGGWVGLVSSHQTPLVFGNTNKYCFYRNIFKQKYHIQFIGRNFGIFQMKKCVIGAVIDFLVLHLCLTGV